MAFDRKKLGIIVALISIALSGLILIQSLLLTSAYRSKEETFRRNALSALSSTVQRLTAVEVLALTIDVDSLNPFLRSSTTAFHSKKQIDDSTVFHSYSFSFDNNHEESAAWIGNDSARHAILRNQQAGPDTVRPLVDDSDSTQHQDSTKQSELRMIMVQSVLNRLDSADQFPLEERIDRDELDSLLLLSLNEAGIDISPAYGVRLTGEDSLRIAQPDYLAEEIMGSNMTVHLFPLDLSGIPSELILFFPDRDSYIWWQMAPLLIPTVLLTLIIIASFAYTIRTILLQKRLASTLIDFVNNLTHEFKTPISTVQLACEAIDRDDILSDPERVRQFNAMILSESRRMKDQSDKILQMALLENGEYELRLEPVDLHELIKSVADAAELRLKDTDGRINCHLVESAPVINADPVYMTNILHNLLDNAIKYSRGNPQIAVTSMIDRNSLRISVSDNGIGISRKDTRLVFDKYYRVNQGDRHDVKGFGLGLAFVKSMVEAHGGTITIESEPGVGTTITISFPSSMILEQKS